MTLPTALSISAMYAVRHIFRAGRGMPTSDYYVVRDPERGDEIMTGARAKRFRKEESARACANRMNAFFYPDAAVKDSP
jgi:hypothetical protein